MPNESKHPAEYSLEQLELNLQGSEGIRRAVTAIAATKNQYVRFTKGTHDFSKRVPKPSLRLKLDPAGDLAPPEGHELICRGTAWIDNVETKVVLFRKA